LRSRKEVSKFFNSIDCFLCPSLREGGYISLQEAIWHLAPFITSNVPGCSRMANMFNCPVVELDEFANTMQKMNFKQQKVDTSTWHAKLKLFFSDSLTNELKNILLEIIDP